MHSILLVAWLATTSAQILQNDYPNGWPFLRHCTAPHGPGGIFNNTLRECQPDSPSHFEKSSRIAIVGGGASGVSIAKLLDDRGFRDVTLLELSGRIGGKSKTYRVHGEAHDVGTSYVVGKYECIEHWLDEVGMTEVSVDKGRVISSQQATLADMRPPKSGGIGTWLADYAYVHYGVKPADYAARYDADVATYTEAWVATFGQAEYMFPSEAGVDFRLLNATFYDWLMARGVTALVPFLFFTTAAQVWLSTVCLMTFPPIQFHQVLLIRPWLVITHRATAASRTCLRCTDCCGTTQTCSLARAPARTPWSQADLRRCGSDCSPPR